MEFKKAKRSSCFIKLSLAGPSGSGKTYSALQMAYGLTDDWSKIGVIDTENGSASLYSHLGNYNTLDLSSPFTVDSYVKAIKNAEQSGYKCLVIDSLSHAWETILHTHSCMTGNSFTNWAKLTPLHNKLVQSIQQCKMHVIVTLRSKQAYAIKTVEGKAIPEKLGLKPIARDGIEYEFSLAFDLNRHHLAQLSKDRTGLFQDDSEFIITHETGKMILDWCSFDEELEVSDRIDADMILNRILSSTDEVQDPLARKILDAQSLSELQDVYENNKEIREDKLFRRLCSRRKQEILNPKNQKNASIKQ